MPRETVKDLSSMFDVQVGWSEETVQLGLSTTNGNSIVEVLGEYTEADSIWASLGVDELNKLIRLLRKARDRAYDM
jgi:hypothetical protein